MADKKNGIASEEVRGKRFTLFVEGEEDSSIDALILEILLGDSGTIFVKNEDIRVKTLGGCSTIKSAAGSMHKIYPNYFFLIDRDYHTEKYVNKCRADFLDPNKKNLLVWKRTEIENYFLDPDYLVRSRFCCSSRGELERKILDISSKRMFLDAANHIVMMINDKFKTTNDKTFSNPAEFSDRNAALEKLETVRESFENRAADLVRIISMDGIKQSYDSFLSDMTGNREELAFGVGSWLEMTAGKEILDEVVVNSQCFRFPRDKPALQDKSKKLRAVIRDVLSRGEESLPDDFRAVRGLILEGIARAKGPGERGLTSRGGLRERR